MSDDDYKKWAIGNNLRDEEFDQQFARLAGLEVVKATTREITKAAWVAAKRPPIVSFIRQNG